MDCHVGGGLDANLNLITSDFLNENPDIISNSYAFARFPRQHEHVGSPSNGADYKEAR